MRSNEEKISTLILKSTFHSHDTDFKPRNEICIHSVKEIILILRNEIAYGGLRKELIADLILNKEDGLIAILALMGLSKSFFRRLITVIRISDNKELCKLVYKDKWSGVQSIENFREWNYQKIRNFTLTNKYFREGLVNLFFEGATNSYLTKMLPLFEVKKLSVSKLQFDEAALIDTIVRYSVDLNSNCR